MNNNNNEYAICGKCDTLKAHLEVELDNHHATRVCLKADISSLEFRLKEALKERDELREANAYLCDVNAELRVDEARLVKERDEARREQNADERICAQRDQALKQCDVLRAERLRLIDELRQAVKERDEARREQNADERICAQRDEYKSQLNASKRYSAELKNELNHALAELHTLRANTAPEPSRLEMAARIMQAMQGWAAAVVHLRGAELAALRHADTLIAAEKEVQP